jgi:YidC/Oxa1 family membrane protein insertase
VLAHVLATSPLDPLYYTIGWLLAFFYTPIHNLGISIILLTLVVMLAQFPLIAKQTRSMIQMQKIQPELKKIQQKYKDDRAKQTEELQKFYSENHINPLAGCLPLLVIFPIGIAVFRTFSQGVQRHLPHSGAFGSLYKDICRQAATAAAKNNTINYHPPTSQPLDLSTCNYNVGKIPHQTTIPVFKFLGMNLNFSAHEAQQYLHGFQNWAPYFGLIALVILTGWYQVRQTQARQSKQGGTPPNAQMQAITKVMPVFFGFITYGLNAATTVYFVVSNAWRIGQQHFVLNKFYEEEAAGAKKPKPKVDDVIDVEPSDNGKPDGAKAPPARRPSGQRPAQKRTGAKPSGSVSRQSGGGSGGSGSGGSGAGGGASAGNGSGSRSGANAGAARRKKKRKR